MSSSHSTRPTKADSQSSPDAALSQWSLAALVIASMIGAGVFTTSGFAIADLRDPNWVMAAWAVGGLIAICGAIGYGQLARLLIDNGGEYLYLSRFVHPMVGFIAGWVSFLTGFTGGGALAAIAMEGYALPAERRPDWLPPGSLAIGLVVLATLTHAFHTRRGAGGHNALVIVKLILVGGFIAISFATIGRWQTSVLSATTLSSTMSDSPTVFAFATTVMWISLSYCGFNAAIYVAGEASGGWSAVAGSMIKSVIGVSVIYLALNAIFLYGPATSSISGQQNIAVIAAEQISGDPLAALVRIAICLALASSVSSTIVAGPRVYAKMADDGVFPVWFSSKVSPPTRSVILQGTAIVLVILVTTLQDLLAYLGLTLSLCSAATVGILLTRRRDDFAMGWIGRGASWIYVVATCVTAALAAWHRPGQTTATIITFISGALAYGLIRFGISLNRRGKPGSERSQ